MLKLVFQYVFKKYTVFLHQSHSINAGIKVGQGGEENCCVQEQIILKTCQPVEDEKLYSFIRKLSERLLQGKGI